MSYSPTPSTPLGFMARVAPSWGGQATSETEALWGRDTMAGLAPGRVAPGTRLDGEAGYGVAIGSRFVGTPRVGVSTSAYGRDYRLGYSLGMLNREALDVELSVDTQRRESPRQGGVSTAAFGRGHGALVAARADRRLAVTDPPRPETSAPMGTTPSRTCGLASRVRLCIRGTRARP